MCIVAIWGNIFVIYLLVADVMLCPSSAVLLGITAVLIIHYIHYLCYWCNHWDADPVIVIVHDHSPYGFLEAEQYVSRGQCS